MLSCRGEIELTDDEICNLELLPEIEDTLADNCLRHKRKTVVFRDSVPMRLLLGIDASSLLEIEE